MSGFTQINVGATANDGTGDSLRVSQQAVNTNFTATPRVLDLTSDLASEIAASSYARVVSNIAEGGIFKAVNSGTPDNINIFASATVGWTWQRIQSSKDRLSIADFNVLPSNSAATNDTNIALAITAAKTLKKPLYAPAGTYNFSAAIDARSNYQDTFAGIIGDGRNKTIFVQESSNIPIVKFNERYFNFGGMTLKYDTYQTPAQTGAIALLCEDWVYFANFYDLLIEGGYIGIGNAEGDDTNKPVAFFSNSLANVRFLNNCYRTINFTNGTGNTWANIYISNVGINAVDNLIYLGTKPNDTFNQLNTEHSNVRDSVFYSANLDNLVINNWHIEGIRLFGKGSGFTASYLRTNTNSTNKVNGLYIDKAYIGPQRVTSITYSGTTATVTIDALDSQQQYSGFRVGDSIKIDGATEAVYNGNFTVTGTPSALVLTCELGGTPTANSVPDYANNVSYVTCQLGTSDFAASIVKTDSPALNVEIDGLRIRDVIVTGKDSSSRRIAFRFADEGSGSSTSANVQIRNLSLAGEIANASFLEDMTIAAFEVVSNVCTVYTKYKHGLANGRAFVIRGASDSDYNVNRTVASVLSDHAFTMNLTKSDTGLVAGSGTITLETLTAATRARASNIVTIETDGDHGLVAGMAIRPRFGTDYDATNAVVLTVPTSDSLTYVAAGSDEAETAETGPIMVLDAGISPIAYSNPSSSRIIKEIPYFMEGCASLDFGSITAGTPQTVSVTFEGVFAGDMVQFTELNAWENGVIVDARISASDTIMFRAQNLTGSPINPAVNVVFFKVTRN
jgi:hypothetical protein